MTDTTHATTTTAADAVLRPADAARYLGVAIRTLEDWRLTGRGPEYVRISSRAVRYRMSALTRWLDERSHTSTAAEGTRA